MPGQQQGFLDPIPFSRRKLPLCSSPLVENAAMPSLPCSAQSQVSGEDLLDHGHLETPNPNCDVSCASEKSGARKSIIGYENPTISSPAWSVTNENAVDRQTSSPIRGDPVQEIQQSIDELHILSKMTQHGGPEFQKVCPDIFLFLAQVPGPPGRLPRWTGTMAFRAIVDNLTAWHGRCWEHGKYDVPSIRRPWSRGSLL